MSIWDKLKDTAESIGGVFTAPAGVVWDLASAPFDDDDDDWTILFRSPMQGMSKMLDPLLNQDTLTGASANKVMEAANWALDNGVNRPISTFLTQVQHATDEKTVADRLGSMFSPDDWAKSWGISDEQNAGQAFATMTFAAQGDPFGDFQIDPHEFENPYDDWTHPEFGGYATGLSWSANVAGAIALDPFYLAGKGLGAARMASQAEFAGWGRLKAAQKAELGALLADDTAREAKRVTNWANWVARDNKLGRPLTGPEILAATPELKKWGTEPHAIASLVADASKIGDDATRLRAVKDILAVAGGDQAALNNLRRQQGALASYADALKNMQRGGPLTLERIAVNPDVAHDPLFVRYIEGQLDRLNTDAAIDKAIDGFSTRLDMMAGTSGTLPNLPGRHFAGGRAVKRLNDQDAVAPTALRGEDGIMRGGALRAPRNAHLYAEDKALKAAEKVDNWAASHFNGERPMGFLLQKGAHYMPLAVIKTGSFVVKPYTTAPVSVADALRQTHFIPTVNTHDWGGATTQLDSMMKLSHVPTLKRMEIVGRAGLIGNNETAKLSLINEVERESMSALAKRYGEKAGHEIDRAYIEGLMDEFANMRGKTLAQIHGRAYAATTAPDSVATGLDVARSRGMAAAEDATTKAASKGFNPEAPEGVKWTVDMIADESGMPVHLPLLSSQLANQVPLIDVHMAKMLLKRDTSHLSTLSKAWRQQVDEADELTAQLRLKGRAAPKLERAIQARRDAADWLHLAGQRTLRAWKMSVLFRLGYPARVILDDHWRIWSSIGLGQFSADNLPELAKNYRYNQPWWKGGSVGGRQGEAKAARAAAELRFKTLRDELDSDAIVNYADRASEHARLARSSSGLKANITKARKKMEEEGADRAALQAKIEGWEARIAENEEGRGFLQQLMGERTPDMVKRELEAARKARAEANESLKNVMPAKRRLGEADVDLGDGVVVPGGFAGGAGAGNRTAASSNDTYQYELSGVEESYVGRGRPAAHVTIGTDNPGHLHAWADVLNNQFRNSPEAMHFLKGGTVEEFVAWVKAPEQAALRRRLPHYAHDPEDWGMRIEAMVHDYVPSDELREMIAKGQRVNSKTLNKLFPVQESRPMVHGAAVGDTTGKSARALGIGQRINETFGWLAAQPTDRLSRHPFFNSLYKMHARELADLKKAHKAKLGEKFTQADIDDIATQARKLALGEVKRTLYDLSAHSHAAHVMRFLSPFFAAHQEVLSRWWRLVSENPGLVRRLQQTFDAPRYAGLTVDREGDPVPPGAPISKDHQILLPLPWGDGNWSINENSFNIILQGGITNPGVGPLVTVPAEQMVKMYPEDDDIRRVARVFNPYPPNSPMEATLPAWFKRAMGVSYGAGGPDVAGIGKREFNDLFTTNIVDATVDFQRQMGRPPTKEESKKLLQDAKYESLVEAMFKFGNNAFSPFPARPNSKYATIQRAAWQYREKGREMFTDPTTGEVDFKAASDWAYSEFKSKYGEAYMPLFYSDVNNESGLGGTPSEVRAYKRHQRLAQSLDPRLMRAIIGPETVEGEEIAPEARNFFKSTPIAVGSDKTLISTMDPSEVAYENMVRQGWAEYGAVTAAITAMAQQAGLSSYEDSDELVARRKAAIGYLQEKYWAWAEDYQDGPDGTYDELLTDMRTLAKSPLADDPTRGDLVVLREYLDLRDQLTAVYRWRIDNGMGGPDAAASEPLREWFRAKVGQMVESNLNFESHIYNGLVERDPYLRSE